MWGVRWAKKITKMRQKPKFIPGPNGGKRRRNHPKRTKLGGGATGVSGGGVGGWGVGVGVAAKPRY